MDEDVAGGVGFPSPFALWVRHISFPGSAWERSAQQAPPDAKQFAD